MSVESSVSKVVFAGEDFPVTYNIPFRIDNASDLVVVSREISTGTELTVNPGLYTVGSIGNPAGCTAYFDFGWGSDSTLTFYREVSQTQLTTYAANDSFPAASHERALDKLTFLVQQAIRKVSQCFRVTEASTTPTEKRSIPLSVLGLDGAGQLVFRSSQEMVSFLSLTAPLVDNPVATWADAAERAVKVPDFLGQLGLERATLKVYHSTGVSAGNWVASQADPSDLSVSTGKIQTQAVTNGKLAHVATRTIKGRSSAGTGDVQDLTASQALDLVNTGTVLNGRDLMVRNLNQAAWGVLTPGFSGAGRFLKIQPAASGGNCFYYKDVFVPFGTTGTILSQVINTVIPFDDTSPLPAEGQEVANYSTVTDYGVLAVFKNPNGEADPFAVISFSCPVVASAVSTVVVSVFRSLDGGATQTLVYAAPFSALAVNHRMNVAFSFFDVLSSVSASGSNVSYSIRMGVTTGTATIGGISGGLLGSQQRTLFSVHIFQR
jgi:hypothetical protein